MFKWKKPKHDLDIDIRFLLANERTLLAWIRTALTLIAGGVAVAFISTDSKYGTIAGMGAVAFGGLLTNEFLEEDGKTKIVSTSFADSTEQIEELVKMGMIEGFSSQLNKLDTLVS